MTAAAAAAFAPAPAALESEEVAVAVAAAAAGRVVCRVTRAARALQEDGRVGRDTPRLVSLYREEVKGRNRCYDVLQGTKAVAMRR